MRISVATTQSCTNKYVRPRKRTLAVSSAYPLASHVECAPRAPLSLEKNGTDRRTDTRPLHYAYRYWRGQPNNNACDQSAMSAEQIYYNYLFII